MSYLQTRTPRSSHGDGIVDAQEAAAGRRNMQTRNYMRLINSLFGIQMGNQRLVNLAA